VSQRCSARCWRKQPPVTEAAALTGALVGFARLLRERGLSLSPAEASRLQAALAVLPPGDIGYLYWAARACLAVPPALGRAYDAAFAEYFLGIQGAPAGPDARDQPTERSRAEQDQPGVPSAAALDVAHERGDDAGEEAERRQAGEAASAAEVLRITPFPACTPQELDILAAMARRLRARPPQRPGRRMAPGYRKEAVDLRSSVRRAMKTQADLLVPAWRQHQRRPRRVVVLLDVSRSMTPYSRLLLQFGYALVASRTAVEVVCFGTQLTRITGLLRSRRSARALERAAMSVLDWNGGTRIADAVGGLRSMRSVRGALRGAVVVICSDGLEQGDPADLGHQMYLLRRTCHQVIWVNPLAGDERYQPIAGGMRAALPWVDALMPGHTLAALENVAAVLSGAAPPPRSLSRPAGLVRPARPADPARPAHQAGPARPELRPAPARA
jgi:uncharacterized protein with von Willebrand factor type A (vWA) domain